MSWFSSRPMVRVWGLGPHINEMVLICTWSREPLTKASNSLQVPMGIEEDAVGSGGSWGTSAETYWVVLLEFLCVCAGDSLVIHYLIFTGQMRKQAQGGKSKIPNYLSFFLTKKKKSTETNVGTWDNSFVHLEKSYTWKEISSDVG